MEVQSWTESWKMKQQTHPQPPPPKSWMKPCKSKTHHFPSLVCREGGIDFPSKVAEYLLILTTQDCVMKFLLQATQYHGDLWRQNHDDKLVRVSGIFSRPRSVTSSVLTKYSNYNSKLILTAGRVIGKRKKENKNKMALEPCGVNQRNDLSMWHLSF